MKMIHVIAIVLLIIVPMALILTAYSNSQLKTIQYQVAYDTKLRNSTYDAIKAFQLNMSNSSTSDFANSKIRDIEASANVFYTSLSKNFTSNGYTKETLKNYVPALVYTLYDGYYIYSPYENTLDGIDLNNNSEYSPGDLVYGLKPYIYYSCRYKPNNDSDFVITYSLDSYITIQGMLNGEPINKSGYLLTGVKANALETEYKYGNVDIETENGNLLQENIYIEDYKDSKVEYNNTTVINHYEGKCIKAPHIKYQGTKYYLQGDNEEDVGYKYKDYESGHIFHMLNEERLDTDTPKAVDTDSIEHNQQALQYYKDAYKFKKFIESNDTLNTLKSNDAVRINGENYDENNPSPFTQGISIFGELDGSKSKYIEDKDSDFYLHRTEVIKNAIESNLMVAIDNFNKVSSSSTQFAMPRLTESDWENLTNGISMISFLQGLSIGGKIFNSYSIVSNDVNDDYVGENSIYIVINGNSEGEGRGTYYLPTDNTLKNIDLTNAIGVFNTNFEQRTIIDTVKTGDVEEKYEVNYLPRVEYAAYTSVINPGDSQNNKESVAKLMKKYATDNSSSEKEKEIARIYYTALARERQGMYRIMSYTD